MKELNKIDLEIVDFIINYDGGLKIQRKEISQKMVEISRYLYDKGLVSGNSGNISFKFDKDDTKLVAVTPSGLSLRFMVEKEILIVDMDGKIVYNSNDRIPTSELSMHLNIYKNREDVNAIIHTHSPFATGFAFAGEKIERNEGFGPITEKYIPFIEYKQPGSIELAEEVSMGLKNNDLIVLKNHGIVALGKTLDEASLLAEFIEEIAKTQFISKMLMSNRF